MKVIKVGERSWLYQLSLDDIDNHTELVASEQLYSGLITVKELREMYENKAILQHLDNDDLVFINFDTDKLVMEIEEVTLDTFRLSFTG